MSEPRRYNDMGLTLSKIADELPYTNLIDAKRACQEGAEAIAALQARCEELMEQRGDEAWKHAACLTIAETGQKWGDGVTPSLAMQVVYDLKCEHASLMTSIDDLKRSLQHAKAALEEARGMLERLVALQGPLRLDPDIETLFDEARAYLGKVRKP